MATQPVSALERWLSRVQNSWLQVLVLVNKDTTSSSASVAASEFISFLQLLTVPGAACASLPTRLRQARAPCHFGLPLHPSLGRSGRVS